MSVTELLSNSFTVLKLRPLLSLIICWTTGVIAAAKLNTDWLTFMILAICFCAFWLLAFLFRHRSAYIFLAFACFFVSSSYASWRFTPPISGTVRFLAYGQMEVIGYPLEKARRKNRSWNLPFRLQAKKEGGIWKESSGTVYLSGNSTEVPEFSQCYHLYAEVTRAKSPGNRFDFDQRQYLLQKGIYYKLRCKAILPLSQKMHPSPWHEWRIECTRKFASTMPAAYSQIHAQLLQSLVLGIYGSPLPAEIFEQFRLAGLLHLVVVSGSQIALLGMLLLLPLNLLPMGRVRTSYPRLRAILLFASLPILLLYISLADRGPSVDRALLMLLLIALSIFCALSPLGKYRSFFPDGLTLLATAALIQLLVQPALLFGASFQLSFAAVLGLMLISPVLMRSWNNYPAIVTLPLAATLGAQLLTAPILIWHFGTIPLIAPLTNIIAVPAVALLLPLGLSSLIASFIWPSLAIAINYLALPLLKLLTTVSRYAAACEWAQWHYFTRSAIVILMYYLILALITVKFSSYLNKRTIRWQIKAGKMPTMW